MAAQQIVTSLASQQVVTVTAEESISSFSAKQLVVAIERIQIVVGIITRANVIAIGRRRDLLPCLSVYPGRGKEDPGLQRIWCEIGASRARSFLFLLACRGGRTTIVISCVAQR